MQRKFVCYPFVGDTVGGSHVSMVPVIQRINEAGFEPVVVIHRPGPLADYLESQGVEFVEAPLVWIIDRRNILVQVFGMLRAALILAPFLRRNDIAIVHTNDGRMHLTWGLASRIAGCRFIWHQRSANSSRRLAVYTRLADAVLTISRHCKEAFPGLMSQRAKVILDPVMVEASAEQSGKTRAGLCRDLGIAADAPVIGFVGNLTRQKRPSFFVEVAGALRDRLGVVVAFPMFGEIREGLAEDVQARIDELGLNGQCRLMGPRYPIKPWIASCDVLVAPAIGEGLGRTLVEAMLVGTPVVAANDAGHREVIVDGETGFLVPPDDVEAFADAVLKFVRSEKMREAMCNRARHFALNAFSEDTHVREVAAVYRKMLGMTAAGRGVNREGKTS